MRALALLAVASAVVACKQEPAPGEIAPPSRDERRRANKMFALNGEARRAERPVEFSLDGTTLRVKVKLARGCTEADLHDIREDEEESLAHAGFLRIACNVDGSIYGASLDIRR
jgi:hypothetical protein